MPEYEYAKSGAVNASLLSDELAAFPEVGFTTRPGFVTIHHDTGLTAQQQSDIGVIIAAHNPAGLSKQQEIDEARAAIVAGRKYLQRQLASVSPDGLPALVSTIKPAVDGNTYLLRMVSNKIDVMAAAFAWTAADVKTPATPANRARYIEACCQIIALLE